jgi:4-hydroxy-tetrahydrodipicolinate reductase
MRIALYGYGRMGRAIEQAAAERGHEVVLKVGSGNAGSPPTGADVAIEFSRPEQAVDNMRLCLEHRVPVVVGTTGWYDRMPEVGALVKEHGGSLLWASNFSIGVNIFFRINRLLSQLMNERPEYAAHIDEIHHVHKLDAPSGTAITLATDIGARNQRYAGWELASSELAQARRQAEMAGTTPAGQDVFLEEQRNASGPVPVPILSERVGEVPGKHAVTWNSTSDRIIITHDAFGRTGFAGGAVLGAEWLMGRTGMFTMDDVLGA